MVLCSHGSGLAGRIFSFAAGRQLDFIDLIALDVIEGYHADFDRYSNRVSWELVACRGLYLIEQVVSKWDIREGGIAILAGGFAVILIGGVEGLIHIGILHPVITSRPQLKLRPRQQRIIRVRIHLGEGEGCHLQRIGNGDGGLFACCHCERNLAYCLAVIGGNRVFFRVLNGVCLLCIFGGRD